MKLTKAMMAAMLDFYKECENGQRSVNIEDSPSLRILCDLKALDLYQFDVTLGCITPSEFGMGVAIACFSLGHTAVSLREGE